MTLRAYFPMSTANPTGLRPWNFAFQGGLSFYLPANYPLPQATLPPKGMGWAGANRNIPMLRVSSFTGKANYGEPYPTYLPLSAGLGRTRSRRLGIPARLMVADASPVTSNAILYRPPTNIQPVGPVVNPVYTASGMPTVTAAPQPAPPVLNPGGSTTLPIGTWPAPKPVGPIYTPIPVSVPLVPTTPSTIAAQVSPPATSAPAAQVAASTPSQSTAVSTAPASTPSWFTDPAQELITGIPNWGLLAAAAAAALLLMRGRR